MCRGPSRDPLGGLSCGVCFGRSRSRPVSWYPRCRYFLSDMHLLSCEVLKMGTILEASKLQGISIQLSRGLDLVCKLHEFFLQSVRKRRVRIGGAGERLRMDWIAKNELDRMQPEAPPARPHFKAAAYSNRHDRYVHFAG